MNNNMPVSLLINTILSGFSAGTYIIIGLLGLFSQQPSLLAIEKHITIVCLIVMCISLLASATHLGKPLRMPNALTNPKSMITQEGYWGMLFVLALSLASYRLYTGSEMWPWLYVIGIIVAFAVLLVTALVYVKAKGIPAWNNGSTIFSFLFSAGLIGSATCLAFLAVDPQYESLTHMMAAIVIALIALQILTAIATEIQISANSAWVEIPKLMSMNVWRWIFGFIVPVVLIVMSFFLGTMPYQRAGLIALMAVVVGEILSRMIFFMRGIHLRSSSSLW